MTNGIIQEVLLKYIKERESINRAWSDNEILLINKIQQELIEKIRIQINAYNMTTYDKQRLRITLLGDNEQ